MKLLLAYLAHELILAKEQFEQQSILAIRIASIGMP